MASEKKPCLEPPASWSALPLELAGLVLRLLPAYAERARFAVVCPQWCAAVRQLRTATVPLPVLSAGAAARQVLPPSPSLPLIALPDGTFYSLPYSKPFGFPGCGFAGYDSACGSWLTFQRDDGCFLVDPFSREKVKLPALSSVRLRPPNAFAEWSYEHRTRFADPYYTWMHMEEPEKLHIRKLILSSANLVAALVGIRSCQILMCQPGALSWSVRANDELKEFEDMAFYEGKLYVITTDENLLVMIIGEDPETGDPQVSKIGRVIKDKGDPSCYEDVAFTDNFIPHKSLYLVESRGKLLMVRKTNGVPEQGVCIAGQTKFEVFEADFEHSRWVKVSSVGGDQVLFLARRCSRTVPVSQYKIPGDRIFFLDENAEENMCGYNYDEPNVTCSAYDMRLGKVSSPYPMISWDRCSGTRPATWLFPQD